MTYRRDIERNDYIALFEESTHKRIRAWFKARTSALTSGLLEIYFIVTHDFTVGLLTFLNRYPKESAVLLDKTKDG